MGDRLPMKASVTGVVLAGGQSRRFGSDKALAIFRKVSLLERSVLLLTNAGLEVLVVTHPARDYQVPQARMIHDLIPDRGPLGGIYTAIQSCQTPKILVLTCDMPCVTPELIAGLLAADDPANEATLYQQPFPGIYASSLERRVEEHVLAGRLEVHDFLSHLHKVKRLKFEGTPVAFSNINTEEELTLCDLQSG